MRNQLDLRGRNPLSACAALFACVAVVYADGVETTPLTNAKAGIYLRNGPPVAPPQPLPVGPGPILFLDESLIESSSGIERTVSKPERDPAIANPIVTGKEDGCFQPYLSVQRDVDSGRFRLWYGRHTDNRDTARSRIGYMESADGIRWEQPAQTLDDPAPIQFGVSVTDAWEAFRDPARRYVYAWHMDGGLNIAASEDKGLTLNVDAKDGEVRVAILDLDGNVIEGFGLADCAPIAIDALNAQVEWGRPAGEWLGNAVRPEIVMRNARLFAVNVE